MKNTIFLIYKTWAILDNKGVCLEALKENIGIAKSRLLAEKIISQRYLNEVNDSTTDYFISEIEVLTK